MIKQVKTSQDGRAGARLRVVQGTRCLCSLGRKSRPGRRCTESQLPCSAGGVLSSHPEPFRKGSVWKHAALHLANVHLCFLLESITFFTSPGLFTQTSCSLTTRIAFSAILLTAQMSAVSLGVWRELLLDPNQPSQRSF